MKVVNSFLCSDMISFEIGVHQTLIIS